MFGIPSKKFQLSSSYTNRESFPVTGKCKVTFSSNWAYCAAAIALTIGASFNGAMAQSADIAPAQTATSVNIKAPQDLIMEISTEVLNLVKSDKDIQAGNLQKVMTLVDSRVMPHVNFQRMTAAAVGRNWRQATPTQRKRLQEEFKILLIRTYSGALSQVKDQTIQLKPMRSSSQAKEVIVRTEVRGSGEPIQLDYRMENSPAGWRIYDVNILGVWLVENYRNSFAQEINAGGIDGLINKMAERNRTSSNNGSKNSQ
jgi:phospholipid transport system substrate-binding protein